MAKVFLSHASEDQRPTDDVHEWLLDGGHEVFLDRDMRDGIALGEEWEERLHERLRWADAVVCVVTSAYISSVWCTAEIGIARSRGCRLLPVLAEPGVRHPLLASLQHVDSTMDGAAAREWIAQELRRVDAVGGFGWPDDRSPFPGCGRLPATSIERFVAAPVRSSSSPRSCGHPRASSKALCCCWLALRAAASPRWSVLGCSRLWPASQAGGPCRPSCREPSPQLH